MKSPVGASLAKASPEPEENDYETEDNLRTLMNAHKIINHPEKMSKVHALAGRHSGAIKAIKSTQDLKDLYNKKYGASSAKQENSETFDNIDNGGGSDGNSKSSSAKPHLKSSPKQKNSLKKPSTSDNTGVGDDGN